MLRRSDTKAPSITERQELRVAHQETKLRPFTPREEPPYGESTLQSLSGPLIGLHVRDGSAEQAPAERAKQQHD